MKLSLLVLLLCSVANAAIQDGNAIQGVWVSGDGDGWIELTVENDELKGQIAGSPDDPEQLKPPRRDVKNPDPALRSRPLLGLTILTGFRHDGGNQWIGGRIYDPNSGNTYKGTITVVDADTLRLRGYVGISLFGRSETWHRKPE